MRNLLMIVCLLFAGILTAQEKFEPKYEQVGDQVKVTYFHSNGKVFQEGFFKDKKPNGLWAQFDNEGNQVSKGFYKDGKKEGLWLYWTANLLKEVTYVQNKIIDVQIKEDDVKFASN